MPKSRHPIIQVASGIFLGLRYALPYLFRSYFITFLGEVIMLCFIYAVHRIILLTHINIPASVVCMLILFIGLLVLEKIIGSRKTTKIVRIIEGTSAIQSTIKDIINRSISPVNSAQASVMSYPVSTIGSIPQSSNEAAIPLEILDEAGHSVPHIQRPEPAASLNSGHGNSTLHLTNPSQTLDYHTNLHQTSSSRNSETETQTPSTGTRLVDYWKSIRHHFVFTGPAGFSLRWINICFIPAFITLPLTDRVTAAEALEIAGVFTFGFLLTFVITVYMVLTLQKIAGKPRKSHVEDIDKRVDIAPGDITSIDTAIELPQFVSSQRGFSLQTIRNSSEDTRDDESQSSKDSGIPTADRMSFDRQPGFDPIHAHGDIDHEDGRNSSSGSLVLENISITNANMTNMTNITNEETNFESSNNSEPSTNKHKKTFGKFLHKPVPESNQTQQPENSIQDTQQLCLKVAHFVVTRIDYIFYTVCLVTGLCVYWASPTSYAMPAQMSGLVLCFLIAMQVPPKYRVVLHPIITSAFLCVGLYYFMCVVYTSTIPSSSFDQSVVQQALATAKEQYQNGTIKGGFVGITSTSPYLNAPDGGASETIFSSRTYAFPALRQALWQFKTGRNYLNLFDKNYNLPYIYNPKTATFVPALPGAGDIMSSLLDISIVALAVPMYNYRNDLTRNFFVIMTPCIILAISSFFTYPPLCYAVGISANRAVAFVARSVTLALALPIVEALDGSTSLVAVVGILSGIVGVLCGERILKLLRVRDDDYVTKGIAIGINSSAVGSAHLLTTDPRAGALSSLSFFVFGTTLVILAAITPLVGVIRGWVGLN